MVGWSLSHQDNKTVNRITGMSDTLPIGKTRYSDKAKTVFQKHRQGKRLFSGGSAVSRLPPFYCVLKKHLSLFLNEILKTDTYTCSVYAVNCFVFDNSFPSVVCFRSRQRPLYRREREKVFGLNTLWKRKILPETAQPPDLFTFNKVCTNLMYGQGNWRLTVCNSHIDLQMLFSISPNFSESCSMS